MEHSASTSKGGGKIIGVLVVVALIVLVVFLDTRRREAEKKLTELSMKYDQTGNQAQNQQVAKQIIERVKRLYVIPEGVDPTVATIVHVNQLRARNAFYNKAKNGDHLIVTNDRAILYDPVADKIVDVVPVQIQAPTPQPTAKAPAAARPAPTPVTPTPAPAASSAASVSSVAQ